MTDAGELSRWLAELAHNYRWTWHPPTRELFARLPAAAAANASPCTRVARVDLTAVARDAALVAAVQSAHETLTAELAEAPAYRSIAYFSPEFGLAETFHQYAGGLGVLAGDHLKAASDRRLPLVGLGLLYREGAFHQRIEGGAQHEYYEPLDAAAAGLTDTGVRVRVELDQEHALVAVWRLDVGTVPLYLLDTALPENTAETRAITNRLYSGDEEHRLRQEIVLGVGGLRALRALGVHPQIFHLNEGHAGFLALELLHELLASGVGFAQALASVRGSVRFTTHTPVPAGIDRFARGSVERYLGAWAHRHHVAPGTLLALGEHPDDPPGVFNMAAFCLRIAGRTNGVSRLHGEVSRGLFSALPGSKDITSVTNGVHARTWVAPAWQQLFDGALGPAWANGDPLSWQRVDEIADRELAQARTRARADLVARVRACSPQATFDPDALTVGFARRFATYKRAALLLQHEQRLGELLQTADRPIQFVFAGKAHPADHEGKALIETVVGLAHSAVGRGRVVFLPDYDMGVARALYHGCDVWLNTPVRALEACGTSGMKAALNGALHCSTLDGWWDEAFDGSNGWAIPSVGLSDPAARDRAEAAHLLDTLQWEIVPLFYADGGRAPSGAWWRRVRHAWRTLGPRVTAARMLDEYADRIYAPLGGR